MYYECIINNVPVTCQIIDVDCDSEKYLIEYQDKSGPLQTWVNPDIIRGTAVPYEISQ